MSGHLLRPGAAVKAQASNGSARCLRETLHDARKRAHGSWDDISVGKKNDTCNKF